MSSPASQSATIEGLNRAIGDRLPGYLAARRWFGGKARPIRSAAITEAVPIPGPGTGTVVLFVRVEYADASEESYVVPVVSAGDGAFDGMPRDAFEGGEFCAAIWDAIARERVFAGANGEIRGSGAPGTEVARGASEAPAARLLGGEQSNTSVNYGGRFIFKLFRRVQPGVNPDLEVGSFLTSKRHFAHVPPVEGWLQYRAANGEETALGILQGFVANEGDAWRYAGREVRAFFERVERGGKREAPAAARTSVWPAAKGEAPGLAGELMQGFLNSARLLGQRTGELHLALGSDSADTAFAPEPFTEEVRRGFEQNLREMTEQVFSLLRLKKEQLPAEVRGRAAEFLACEPKVLDQFHELLARPIEAARTRIHGDYHLGQVLWTGSDFVIIDFEGEPARPLAERRAKRSPLQDVAGMLRSFHYAAFSPLFDAAEARDEGGPATASRRERLLPWADVWSGWAGGQFLSQYLATTSGAAFIPAGREDMERLLRLYLLQKAIYELGYELNNRPAWIEIPLAGLREMVKGAR